jgi:hypothetical protein
MRDVNGRTSLLSANSGRRITFEEYIALSKINLSMASVDQ